MVTIETTIAKGIAIEKITVMHRDVAFLCGLFWLKMFQQ